MKTWDVAIIGGGILGTSAAYWLASLYDGGVAVVEREGEVAMHTSDRNTGVVHRPFYLDPVDRRVFARASQVSYGLWKRYAAEKGLPWAPVGTLEVALREEQWATLEKYYKWGFANGMNEDELELLDSQGIGQIEPNVRCLGAIHSKTDTAVDYHAYTVALRAEAESAGASFLLGRDVHTIRAEDRGLILECHGGEAVRTHYLINCAGGNSVDFLHMMGLGMEYADLHFRGEYWVVDPAHGDLAHSNVYSVPAYAELPFLDPHWIVRANGRREIGPNAVPVPGPTTYRGLIKPFAWAEKLLESPVGNKVSLLFNRDFLTLVAEEWMSSLSKDAMAQRARRFLPPLKTGYLTGRGTAGVRASVIDSKGNFLKEAIEVLGPNSYHIINYNSPGATGAPAYAAHLVDKLAHAGFLDHLRPKTSKGIFDFHAVVGALGVEPAILQEPSGH